MQFLIKKVGNSAEGLYGKVGNIKSIPICAATRNQKRLYSALDEDIVHKDRSKMIGIVHKSIGENRPALPQSFELSSAVDQYGRVLRTPSWQMCT